MVSVYNKNTIATMELLLLVLFHLTLMTPSLVEGLSMESKEIRITTHETADVTKDKYVYLFVGEGRRKPYNFENADGQLVGFDIDIVNAVCAVAKKKCYTVLTRKEDCIFTDRNIDYAGPGLMSMAIQGCVGYQITTDRQNEFSFTLPYMIGKSTYAVNPGNPKHFDPKQEDFFKFKLVHVNGSPFNSACLNRLGKTYGTLLIAASTVEAKQMLENGTADVLMSTLTTIDGLDVLPNVVHCDSEQGTGLLMKMGSTVPQWWNPAFKELYKSGAYSKLCAKATTKYNANINCLPPLHKADDQLLALMTNVSTKAKSSQKLWRFVVSGRIAPYSFINKDGKLVGFTNDFIMSVCKIACKRCVLLLSEVPECTVRVGELLYPGRGLISGWFDACTGYFNTVDRQNSWDFTDPYLVSNASFYVAPGNPKGFNPDLQDLSSFTIVYQATAITNDHCLHRLHKQAGRLIVVENVPLAIKAVLSGKADAWFTKMVVNESQGVMRLPERFHCGNIGSSIMVRKGSELPNWWNKAFRYFVKTGQYNQFCKAQGKMYKNNFPCLPPSGYYNQTVLPRP